MPLLVIYNWRVAVEIIQHEAHSCGVSWVFRLRPIRQINVRQLYQRSFRFCSDSQTLLYVGRFVLTASVEGTLRCLARAVASADSPVLLQGPTRYVGPSYPLFFHT